MKVIDEAKWAKVKEQNTDPYGARVVKFAEDWANYMEEVLDKAPQPLTPAEFKVLSTACSKRANYDGITGFMYVIARDLLVKGWVHGAALKDATRSA